MEANFAAFATDLDIIPAMTATEKAELIATLKVTYEKAKDLAFEGLIPGPLLVEYGAEMKAIWAALDYTPPKVTGSFPCY